ncbi:MAG: spore maturation protein A [Firmicutes bacterium]|nr:spore maturation protein A [Bacillota bacterium]
MLEKIWISMILISVISALFTNNISELSNSVLEGSSQAVNVTLMTAGSIIFWSGIMKIAQDSGFTNTVSKIFFPLLKFLFPKYANQRNILEPICMNIIANVLGLGNAATPLGITAMKEMQKVNKNPKYATKEMITFLIINTACLQLIPTFLITLRKNYGAENPFDILPKVWVSSSVALLTGIFLVKIFIKNKDTAKIQKNKPIIKKVFNEFN